MKELVDIIKDSKADFVILGGDFNSDPVVNKDETTLTDITDYMRSSIDEIFLKQKVELKLILLLIIIFTNIFTPPELVDSPEGHVREP